MKAAAAAAAAAAEGEIFNAGRGARYLLSCNQISRLC